MMIHFDPGCIQNAIERVFRITCLKGHRTPADGVIMDSRAGMSLVLYGNLQTISFRFGGMFFFEYKVFYPGN